MPVHLTETNWENQDQIQADCTHFTRPHIKVKTQESEKDFLDMTRHTPFWADWTTKLLLIVREWKRDSRNTSLISGFQLPVIRFYIAMHRGERVNKNSNNSSIIHHWEWVSKLEATSDSISRSDHLNWIGSRSEFEMPNDVWLSLKRILRERSGDQIKAVCTHYQIKRVSPKNIVHIVLFQQNDLSFLILL